MKKNLGVFATVFLVLFFPSNFYLRQQGFDDEGLALMLRYTARIALLIYLVIFVARPLRQLSANSVSRWLLTNRRYLGIAFAAVMTVHLWYLVMRNGVQPVITGMIAFLFIYMMLVTSFDKPAKALGPRRWRILHKSGLYFIGIIFTITVVSRLRESPTDALHLAQAALMLTAVGIRVTAYLKKRVKP